MIARDLATIGAVLAIAACIACFTAAATGVVWMKPHPVKPRAYRPHPHSDPYSQPPWSPAPRPSGPRPDTAPLPRLKTEAREADWRIADLTRQFRLPPWARTACGESVSPALHGEVAR